MSGTVLVTGAGGFVGRRAVNALTGAGCRVIAGRRPAVNVLDPASLAAAMPGVETVVHTAVGDPRDTRVITEGTRNTVAAARAAGVRRFIHLSSVAVYGAVTGVVDEDAPTDHPHGAYGAAKVIAEEAVRAADAAMAVAILRPTLIYGPRSTQWTVPYLDRLRAGRLPLLGDAWAGDANLVHVDDLAGFIAHLATCAPPIAGTFHVNGPEVPSWNAYLEGLRAAIGAPSAAGRVPGRITLAARKGAKALATIARLGGVTLPPLDRFVANTPSRDEVVRFATPVRYATDRMTATGYVPRIGLAEGLADIAAWERAGRP